MISLCLLNCRMRIRLSSYVGYRESQSLNGSFNLIYVLCMSVHVSNNRLMGLVFIRTQMCVGVLKEIQVEY